MTTKFTAIINANSDLFDFDRTEADVRNTVFPNETPDMMFEIINGGDFTENDKYAYGWAYEYEKDGVKSFGQAFHFYGSPEECAKQYSGDVEEFFWMSTLNGFIPTGRVWFCGYFEEHFGIDEEGDFGEYYTAVQRFPIPQ